MIEQNKKSLPEKLSLFNISSKPDVEVEFCTELSDEFREPLFAEADDSEINKEREKVKVKYLSIV